MPTPSQASTQGLSETQAIAWDGPLARSINEAASIFEQRIDEIAAVIIARSRDEIAEMREIEAPAIWEVIKAVTRRSRLIQAEYLRRQRGGPDTCLQPELDAVELAVNGDISLAASLQSFRIGHATAREAWLAAIERLDLDPQLLASCIKAVSRFVDDYDSRVMDLFTEEYVKSSELRRRGDRYLIALVREILAGRKINPDAGLNYDLGNHHIAIIAWGIDARSSLQRLAVRCDRPLFFVEPFDQVCWGWLGGASSMNVENLKRLRGFRPTEGCRISMGRDLPDIDGFRQSHREAGDAYLVALRNQQPMTVYEDVALEGLALRDELIARDFMESELQKLANDAKLINTVRAYFACSQNAASTAAALGVHEQTVARRLKTIEEKINQPLNERRAELELALRLAALFHADC